MAYAQCIKKKNCTVLDWYVISSGQKLQVKFKFKESTKLKIGLVYFESVCKRIVLLVKTYYEYDAPSFTENFLVANVIKLCWLCLLEYGVFVFIPVWLTGRTEKKKKKKLKTKYLPFFILCLSLVFLLVVFSVQPVKVL